LVFVYAKEMLKSAFFPCVTESDYIFLDCSAHLYQTTIRLSHTSKYQYYTDNIYTEHLKHLNHTTTPLSLTTTHL